MKNKTVYTLVLFFSIIGGCKEHPTEVKVDNTPRLVLSVDKTSGQHPLTVTYSGKFLGSIDTIKMLVPDEFLLSNGGKTFVRYAFPDTTQPARPIYTETETYPVAGIYKRVMLLQSKYNLYYSDTVTVNVD